MALLEFKVYQGRTSINYPRFNAKLAIVITSNMIIKIAGIIEIFDNQNFLIVGYY
jgi:hypothetical protein